MCMYIQSFCSTRTFLTLAFWVIFHTFLLSAEFFTKKKKYFMNTIRGTNSLDPDQAQHYVGPDLGPNIGPDLGPNCLQGLSAHDTGRTVY